MKTSLKIPCISMLFIYMDCVNSIFLTENPDKIQLKYRDHKIVKRQEELPENITTKEYDHHDYYKKKIVSDPDGSYWTEIHQNGTSVLSDEKHLRYLFYELTFQFPYYGYPLNKVAVTTQGFLYMSSFVHPDLNWAFTHYVAPLMGNFDTIGSDSQILTWDDGNSFVVEWRNVDLHDQPEIGNFTFQTVLYKNGTIVMAYKAVPSTNYSSKGWPVKAGINDAFYYDVPDLITGGYLRYIVPYHNITIPLENITDNMAIIIHPLPTCNIMHTCTDCTTNVTNFNCMWCPSVSRCSDGNDRLRQTWNESMCHNNSYAAPGQCPVPTIPSKPTPIPTKPTSLTTEPTLVTTKTTTITTNPTLITTKSTSVNTKPTSTSTKTTSLTTKTTLVCTKPTSITTTEPTSITTTEPTSITTKPTSTTTKQTSVTTKLTSITTKPTSVTKKSTSVTTKPTAMTTLSTTTTTSPTTLIAFSSSTTQFQNPRVGGLTKKKKDTSAAAVAVPIVIILVVLICLLGGWIFYARTHPSSRAGIWLIENSPRRIKDKISSKFSSFKYSSSDDRANITSKYESQDDSQC